MKSVPFLAVLFFVINLSALTILFNINIWLSKMKRFLAAAMNVCLSLLIDFYRKKKTRVQKSVFYAQKCRND